MSAFTVSIDVGKSKAASSVRVTGSVEHIITDEERSTFGLDDSQLKQAIAKYNNQYYHQKGAPLPNDVYLHDPTPPHGDLYKQSGWSGPHKQVRTLLVASSAEILDITSKPVALKKETFKNDSSHPAVFEVTLHDSVANTVSDTWSKTSTLSVEQKITYEVGFLGSGGGGETSISYSKSWGESGSKSETVTIGSQSSVSITIPPKKSVIATLSASQNVMTVRIGYTASLNGGAVSYYNNKYRDYPIWWNPLPSVMADNGISNSIESTEDVEIDYFSSGTIEITDAETQELLSTHYFPEGLGSHAAV